MNKTFKKALSVVLVLMMVVSTMVILPMTASAAGTGTKADPILVGTKAELLELAATINAAEGTDGVVYVEITDDITVDGALDLNVTKAFYLNGNGYAVSNVTTAIFSATAANTTIVNWNAKNVDVKAGNAGVFVNYADFGITMINCSTDADCSVTTSSNHAGGFIGTIQSKVKDRTDNGDITMINCTNAATVSGSTRTDEYNGETEAGLIGSIEENTSSTAGSHSSDVRIENCVNNGPVYGLAKGYRAAGFVGKVSKANNVSLVNCINLKAIDASAMDAKYSARAGGFVGTVVNCTALSLEKCVNAGNVTSAGASVYIGGFVGELDTTPSVTVNYCVNKGAVKQMGTSGSNQVGGGIGFAAVKDFTISNSYNVGALGDSSATNANKAQFMGGLCGRLRAYTSTDNFATFTMTNCYDYSTRYSVLYASALSGDGDSAQVKKIFNDCYAVKGTGAPNNIIYAANATTTNVAWADSLNADITLAKGTSTIAQEMAAINAVIGTPDISTASGNLEVRIKLTDDFGLMAVADLNNGVGAAATESGFYFSTDAENVKGTKVAGKAYNGTDKIYAVYDKLSAASLDTPIYFAAYVVIEGVEYVSAVRSINPYNMAKDLADGYYGEVGTGALVTTNAKEMALYTEMANYYDAYKAYMDAIA